MAKDFPRKCHGLRICTRIFRKQVQRLVAEAKENAKNAGGARDFDRKGVRMTVQKNVDAENEKELLTVCVMPERRSKVN
jgi:hypothetical protein